MLGIMSTTKLVVSIAAIIGITAIGVALLEKVEHRSTKLALTLAVQHREELHAQVRTAQARIEAAQQEAAASAERLAALEQQALKVSREDSRPSTVKGMSAGQNTTLLLTASRATPADRSKLHQRYDPFLMKFGLSEEQRARFVELKLAIYEAQSDLQQAVENNEVPGSSGGVAALRTQLTKPMWDEIIGLLGSDGYKAYGDYELMSGFRPTAVGLFQESGVPMSDEQMDQITRLIIKNKQTFRAKPTDISSRLQIDWNGVARDAENILTPAQLVIIRAKATEKSSQ